MEKHLKLVHHKFTNRFNKLSTKARLALLFLILVVIIASCVRSTSEAVKVETDAYVVKYIDPPKYYKVDLERVSDHRFFNAVSISKRCSTWSNTHVGDTVMLNRYTYISGNTDYTEFDDTELKNAFCK